MDSTLFTLIVTNDVWFKKGLSINSCKKKFFQYFFQGLIQQLNQKSFFKFFDTVQEIYLKPNINHLLIKLIFLGFHKIWDLCKEHDIDYNLSKKFSRYDLLIMTCQLILVQRIRFIISRGPKAWKSIEIKFSLL